MKEQGVRGNAMQVEIGKIYEGTVKNITKYGAFVDIHNEENEKVMGMVHISEISRSFVNEIRDFVTEGQVVRVKVIGINEQGKISLSMKQSLNRKTTTDPNHVPVNSGLGSIGKSQTSGSQRKSLRLRS